ncbi:MAG: PIN domain-containing protein, partial [Bacteroidota bacterium]
MMIYSAGFKAIIDACVLYAPSKRDYLLTLAQYGFYKPFWTQKINDEWINNRTENILKAKGVKIERVVFEKTVAQMNTAFPDANIENFESLISSVKLPDENDRHVVAAAIKEKVEVIIT